MMYMSDIIDKSIYSDEQKFDILLGNTLDWFYFKGRTKEERQRSVNKPPANFDANHPKFKYASMIQAGTHMLCDVYELEKPEWIFDTRYHLQEPFFAGDARGKLRLVLIMESPVWFKMRNIYVSRDVFTVL